RRDGRRRRARGLPRRDQRRPERGSDHLSPPFARLRWEASHRQDDGDAGDGGGGGETLSLIGRIEDDLKQAMLARDAERRDALRLILSALKSAEKELQRPLHDDEELQVLQRERKRRIEAAEAFRAGGRPEQADSEDRELEVLQEFMPEPLSEEDLEEIVGAP